MTAKGGERVAPYYAPMIREGSALFDGFSAEQLTLMRDWLVAACELTDRHRERISAAHR